MANELTLEQKLWVLLQIQHRRSELTDARLVVHACVQDQRMDKESAEAYVMGIRGLLFLDQPYIKLVPRYYQGLRDIYRALGREHACRDDVIWKAEVVGHLDAITFSCMGFPWAFNLEEEHGDFFLVLSFHAPDAVTGKLEFQRCRRWFLDDNKPAEEVIGTAWLAVQTALLHEAREMFKYNGQQLFSPHWDLPSRTIGVGDSLAAPLG